MEILALTGAPMLLVNLVFAAVALAIGFAAGAWVCGGTETPSEPAPAPELSAKDKKDEQLVLERTMLASDRLRDLANSMASDVGAHSANMDAIEARLVGDDKGGKPTAEMVLQALAEIEKANESLQVKLAKAEEQVQAQAEQIRTHESEARTDSLTSLANRRAFDDEISRRFAEWERRGTPFSLLILDVDHFKKFNDTHGHQAGDAVLCSVADAIAHCAREMDLACRYGGEEFAVIMPTTEGHEGGVPAERIRERIEAMEVFFEGKTLSVTTSIGISGVQPDDDVTHLIKRADEALYASKAAGRNNTHRHTGAECVPLTPGKVGFPAEAAVETSPQTVMLDGLPNRTRFLDLLRTEVKAAHRSNGPLALLTAEFKGYQQLEDQFGEAVAKLTLDSIAQFLDSAISENDSLGRLDGGKFIMLMPKQTADLANKVGERINGALENCSVPLGDTQLQLTTAMRAVQMKADESAVSLMKRVESVAAVAHELASSAS